MKNNSKINFFCLYIGQKVLQTTDNEYNYSLVLSIPFLQLIDNYPNKYWLELKSINDIDTQEKEILLSLGESAEINNLNQRQIDYLRSKSFLIPFRGLSIEDILSLGFAKLHKK